MKKKAFGFAIFFILILFISSCGGNKEKSEIIATVNDHPIPLKEFQKEISLYSKRDPQFKITSQTLEEHLGMLVDKKLMIQEAMKMGLAEDERFVDTIKTFWEQTLIRELIQAKTMEWGDRVFVTEEEIEREYQKMRYGSAPRHPLKEVRDEIKTSLLERKRQRAMEEWLEGVKKSAKIQLNTQLLQKGVAYER